MKTADGQQSFMLRVRLAECERYTVANSKSYAEAEPTTAGRQIRLRNCAVIEANFERAEGRPTTDDKIDLWIDEFYAGLLDIGSFSSFKDIRLRLPPTTFSHFWTASATSDGEPPDITIYFRAETEAFKITRVQLVEHLSDHHRANLTPRVRQARELKWSNILLGFVVAFVVGAILAVLGHEFLRGFSQR
jgi:hypothetical protein